MVGSLLASDRHNDYSSIREFLAGSVAFLLGYAAVYPVVSSRSGYVVVGNPFYRAGLPTPDLWKVAGWFLFAAHNVGAGYTDVTGHEPMALRESVAWEPWFVVVPVLALVLAGAGVAIASGVTDLTNGVLYGGAVVIGYLPVVLVATVLVGHQGSTNGFTLSAGPTSVVAIVLAGVVYPIVCGAIGGAIGSAIASRR